MTTEICIKEAMLTKWYENYFPIACSYIHKNGGSLEDAKEVFQEALIRVYEKKVVEASNVENDLAYLMKAVKNLWISTIAKGQKKVSFDFIDLPEEESSSLVKEKIYHLVKRSGEKCLDLLQSFYYENSSMKSLSKRFGYRSERSATVQKFKCLEKIRNEVKSKSLNYEDFLS
ncbi:RNA polymerase sigma factor [Ekhidna sp.]